MVAPRHHDYYREQSRHFLNLVDEQLSNGDLEIACELLWGAAAHAVKSAAQRNGWDHGAHALLSEAVDRLIERGAPPYILGQYDFASAYHVGFYGDRQFTASNITAGKELMAEFIQTLQSLPPVEAAP